MIKSKTSFFANINFESLIGHKTIIYGEIDTKKTSYTANFIRFLLEEKKIAPKEISILDFGPNLMKIGKRKIGGRILDFYKHSSVCNNLTFQGEIIPPRLNARNRDEIFKNAKHNYILTTKILKQFNENPTSILIINDISIYLHCGDDFLIMESMGKCNTFFGNTYYGISIRSNFEVDFSLKERQAIENILKKVEKSYKTI